VIKINENSGKKWIRDGWPDKKYEVEVWHKELNKYQIIKGKDKAVIEKKVDAKMAEWDALWAKRLDTQNESQEKEDKKKLAEERTVEAQEVLKKFDHLLTDVLRTEHSNLWESLKDKEDYQKPRPTPPKKIPRPEMQEFWPEPSRSDQEYKVKRMSLPKRPTIPREPQRSDSKYKAKLGILDQLISSRRVKKGEQVEELFAHDYRTWQLNKEEVITAYETKVEEIKSINSKRKVTTEVLFQGHHINWKKNKERINADYNEKVINHEREVEESKANYKEKVKKWKIRWDNFLKQQNAKNLAIDEKKIKYEKEDPEGILYFCDAILTKSEYPSFFPHTYELDYNPMNKLLLIEHQLPSVANIPTLKEVQYIKSRDDFAEKHISKTQLNNLYDSILYQISLRTIQELFRINRANVLSSIVFNGFVSSIDPSTGKEVTACVLSLQADRGEFLEINLANVDPKACFRKLKGIGSPQLHSLTPIAPIMTIERNDKRFVSSYEVANKLDEGINLAAMDWEDFEHLVRELFEQEFAKDGGEVKVTRASRDGGVDAVAFDPDPLRGGKIVIQAKRYTNLVGVSAVRDLYGTLLNEGANKGILVTTSNYGPDAYKFAKGKPLVLLDGNNLLHLLQRQGHKAKIDLQEAKLILAEMETATEKK